MLSPGQRVLHLGTGLGYYTAILAACVGPEVVGAQRRVDRRKVGAQNAVVVDACHGSEQTLERTPVQSAVHPDLTALGRFAVEHRDDAVFVATDWGVANQIYCLSNGRVHVRELTTDYNGPEELLDFRRRSGGKIMYLVRRDPPTGVRGNLHLTVDNDLTHNANWREVIKSE